MVCDICGSGRPQQEQTNLVLFAAPGVPLTCESFLQPTHLSVVILLASVLELAFYYNNIRLKSPNKIVG